MSLESSTKIHSEPDVTKNLSEYGQIMFVKLSPFEQSQDLLLIAFSEKIIIGQLELNDDSLDVQFLSEIAHTSRCTSLSISPETLLSVKPNILIFCAAGSDYNLRVFHSDLADNNICKVLSGHKSYINDTSFDPENIYLASTSDDNTVKIWMADSLRLKSAFSLSSPGLNVCWHKADPGKLLVAEKKGLISFYNVENETCIFSLDYGKSLASCHWSPLDNDLMASLHQGELLTWQLPNKCLPLHKCMLFLENGGNLKFSSHGELIAAVNCLDNHLKILHVKSQVVKLTASVTLPTNVCWHYRYPLVCIGDDYNLCFWKVTAN